MGRSLVVRHSGRLVRREAKGGPCTTRDTKLKFKISISIIALPLKKGY
jgi:hypothetical protein